jgi:hypothetical protein
MVRRISAKKYKINPENWAGLHQRLKVKVINVYGGKCVCCGEDRLPFLSFDHVNGGGRAHRKIAGYGTPFLRWIIRNNYPDMLRILCMNCNMAVHQGICPHQLEAA